LVKFKKILLPLDLQESALPVAVIRQATALARHFHAEILILHVVKPLTYLAGSETAHELFEHDVANEQEQLKRILGQELFSPGMRRMVTKGDPAREILGVAQDENIDLIVMPTHGYGAAEGFLLGSVAAKVLHQSKCPVWACAHLEDAPSQQFTIHNVLCAVDFGVHTPMTVRWAQDVANEFGARLTLAHVTASVEVYGPGGYYVLEDMKQELVGSATRHFAEIQRELDTKAEVFIGSGDVPKVMSEAAKERKADLLVVGLGGRLGTSAYGIIRESRVPVLSV
jgi:nucleotide-binding universal stress UspA family protein